MIDWYREGKLPIEKLIKLYPVCPPSSHWFTWIKLICYSRRWINSKRHSQI